MFAAFLHLLLAVLWFLLAGGDSLVSLAFGLLAGFAIIALAEPLLGQSRYASRVLAFLHWLWKVALAFLQSNWQTIRIILRPPGVPLQPIFLYYDVRGLSLAETVLLAQVITLTPGTTSVELNPERTELLLHVLDGADPAAVIAGIDRDLRQPLLAFTRP